MTDSYISFRPLKTGTTIVGVQCPAGLVLGADTRATDGDVVADRRCEKIHRLAPNIYCLGAGTAAIAEHLTMGVSTELGNLRVGAGRIARRRFGDRLEGGAALPSGKGRGCVEENNRGVCSGGDMLLADDPIDYSSRVTAVHRLLKAHIFGTGGQCSLVVGGVDSHGGVSLLQIYGHGASEKVPFGALGSGEMTATAVLDRHWHRSMGLREAVRLVVVAVGTGIHNDLGSGSGIDLLVLTSPFGAFRAIDDIKK